MVSVHNREIFTVFRFPLYYLCEHTIRNSDCNLFEIEKLVSCKFKDMKREKPTREVKLLKRVKQCSRTEPQKPSKTKKWHKLVQ